MPTNHNRIIQPQNIKVYANLFISMEGKELIKGADLGFDIVGNSLNSQQASQKNTLNKLSFDAENQVSLPSSLLQRYGSFVGTKAE